MEFFLNVALRPTFEISLFAVKRAVLFTNHHEIYYRGKVRFVFMIFENHMNGYVVGNVFL